METNVTDNELIVWFMKMKVSKMVMLDTRIYYHIPHTFNDSIIAPMDNFMFDKSWDWLIKVCAEWDNILDNVFNEDQLNEYQRLSNLLDNAVTCYEIEPAYEQLVKCIKWYNSQKLNL